MMQIEKGNAVVITGLGIRSPLGNTVDKFFKSLLGEESDFIPVDFLNLGIPLKASCFKNRSDFESSDDGYIASTLGHEILLGAALDALENACLQNKCDMENTVAIIGTTSGGSSNKDILRDIFLDKVQKFPRHINELNSWYSPSHYLCDRLKLKCGARTIMNACSSGIHAMGYGKMLIQNKMASRVIVGGVNTLGAISLLGFHSIGVMSKSKVCPFDANRDGLFLGEGAAILILESLDCAMARKAPILAQVRGFSAFGNVDETGNLTKPVKDGYVRCMTNAIKDSGLQHGAIDFIHAHGTATVSNDSTEAMAIKECFSDYTKIPVSSTKSSTGHTLGAAGAIASLICVKAINEGIIPPNKNLVTPDNACEGMNLPVKPLEVPLRNILCNSFGFGGNDTSLVISKFEE